MKLGAAVLAITSILAPMDALAIRFVAEPEHSKWHVASSRLHCRISQEIPNFGKAEFSISNEHKQKFVLRSYQAQPIGLYAELFAKAPEWQPQRQTFFLKKQKMRSGKTPIIINHRLARPMLSYLSQGLYAEVRYSNHSDQLNTVLVSPVNFQKPYSRYVKCIGELVPYTFSEVRREVIYFNTNSSYLSGGDKRKLKKIAIYVKADPEVKKVLITGHSDNVGRKGHNHYLSELRARAVRDYFLQQGVDEKRIYFTWFGAKQPITSNENDQQRELNRRVNIRLLRPV